jgi:hypothetical protein
VVIAEKPEGLVSGVRFSKFVRFNNICDPYSCPNTYPPEAWQSAVDSANHATRTDCSPARLDDSLHFHGRRFLSRDVQMGNSSGLGEESSSGFAYCKWPERGITKNPWVFSMEAAPVDSLALTLQRPEFAPSVAVFDE